MECGVSSMTMVSVIRNGETESVLQPICKAAADCTAVTTLKPAQARTVFDVTSAGDLSVKAAGGELLAKLVPAAGSFKIKGGGTGQVNFTVLPVLDSVLQFGAFRKLLAKGLLASALVTIR